MILPLNSKALSVIGEGLFFYGSEASTHAARRQTWASTVVVAVVAVGRTVAVALGIGTGVLVAVAVGVGVLLPCLSVLSRSSAVFTAVVVAIGVACSAWVGVALVAGCGPGLLSE